VPAAVVNYMQEGSRGEGDCGIVALASYLGCAYTDVLRATTLVDRNMGKRGLWRRTMVRIAGVLGHSLKIRRRFDLAEDYGVLVTPNHAVVLRSGLVLDRLAVWDAEDYLRAEKLCVTDCQLLVAEE